MIRPTQEYQSVSPGGAHHLGSLAAAAACVVMAPNAARAGKMNFFTMSVLCFIS